MSEDPITTERRLARREQRLGEGATCVMCGESSLEALTNGLIEQHHVVGQNHDPNLLVPLCRNCHAKLHENIKKEGADLRAAPAFPERLLNMLKSLAAFFTMLGEALSGWACRLAKLIRQLDEGLPAWRALT